MKILKKYLQNRKGLQKLDTKHVPHPPNGEKKIWSFLWHTKEEVSKKGVKGVKKWKFWKNTSKTKKGFKNWILNMCHMPPKRILKKSQNFEFFQKRGLRGSKNDFFEKIFPKRKVFQKLDTKHVPHVPKKDFQKK